MPKENLSLDNETTELIPIQTDPSKPNWNPYPEFKEHCANVAAGFEDTRLWQKKLKKENPVGYLKHRIRSKWAFLQWKYNI